MNSNQLDVYCSAWLTYVECNDVAEGQEKGNSKNRILMCEELDKLLLHKIFIAVICSVVIGVFTRNNNFYSKHASS